MPATGVKRPGTKRHVVKLFITDPPYISSAENAFGIVLPKTSSDRRKNESKEGIVGKMTQPTDGSPLLYFPHAARGQIL
jgi:hypothetical protein